MDSDHDRLFALLNERAYREGDFQLASGKRSSFYFDAKAVLLDGEGARLVARCILAEMKRRDVRASAIGGMELGAVPIACAVSALCPEPPLSIFIVRKKPKARKRGSHGGAAASGDAVTAPMQGTVVKVAVEEGQQVAAGDLVVVLEAMKMENPVTAHKEGTITGLAVEPGAAITQGTVLAEIK